MPANVVVRIPTPLRPLTGGRDEVNASGNTVAEVIEDLERSHPGIRDRLLDEKGIRRFVNVYVGEEDVRFLDGLATKIEPGAAISIVPAIAGGGGASPGGASEPEQESQPEPEPEPDLEAVEKPGSGSGRWRRFLLTLSARP